MANIVNTLTAAVGKLLSTLADIQGSVSGAKTFLGFLGFQLPPGVDDIGLAALNITEFVEKLNIVIDSPEEEWEDEILMIARISDLATEINKLVNEITTLAEELPNDVALSSVENYFELTQIHIELPRRIFDFLAISYLSKKSSLAFALSHFVNLIDYKLFQADDENFQTEHIRAIINYQNFKTLVTDPALLFTETYAWNTPDFSPLKFLERLNLILLALGLPSAIRSLKPEAEEALFGVPAPGSSTSPLPQMISLLHEELGLIDGMKVGFAINGVRPTTTGASDGGLSMIPILNGKTEGSIPFIPIKDTSIEFSAEADVLKKVALILRPDQALRLQLSPRISELASGRFAMGINNGTGNSDPKTLFSFPGGSHLSIREFSLFGGMNKYQDRAPESFMELEFRGGQFVYSLAEADGFLKKSIDQEKVEAGFDFTLGWTQNKGIYFSGGGGLIVAIPLHLELGPINLETLHLALQTQDEGLSVEASTSGRLSLGPLKVSVNRVGMNIEVSFNNGNLGIFGLSPDFKPPSGLGIVIDGGGFKGGGEINFEPDQKRYTGMLELEFKDKISLKAIGLLTTELPNGQEGFSLLIIITAEFSPIQLGFGFTLNGVGGLLGLNRTVKIDRLRSGVRDNTLSSILFPQNIIENSDRIISDLRQVFPPQEGRFVFGPMGKIGWSSIMTIDLGLLIEVPEPIRIAILGVIKAILPTEDDFILKLQVNFLGVIDFEKQQLSFDASLYDSKLLAFNLTGDMALRLYWGEDANFLLSIGGFHPAYQPPPMNLPNLRRLSLSLMEGENPRLTLEYYYAVTSNTVQFGAKAEIYAAAWKFNVYGFISYDVLFQFNPFYFIADVSAMLALRKGSSSFASIKLTFTLEGPTPWKAKGTASLKICWFLTVKVRFNKTFGEKRNTNLPDIAVMPLLLQALNNSSNWEGQFPKGRHLLVTMKNTEEEGADLVLIHPIGLLSISQKVVPLKIRIDKFGNQKTSDGTEFRISETFLGSNTGILNPSDTQEQFAPAQYFEFKDEEKLSAPSFKKYASGIKLNESEALHTNYATRKEVFYELKYKDTQRDNLPRKPIVIFEPDHVLFNKLAVNGTIAKSDLSHARNRKSLLAPEPVFVQEEAFGIVNMDDLRLFDGESLMGNEMQAKKKMEALIANDPRLKGSLQTVPAYELSEI